MLKAKQSGIRRLSEQAQMLLHRMLDQGAGAAAIARAIADETGERIVPQSIVAYSRHYRRRQQQRQRLRQGMDAFEELARDKGLPVTDLLRALLQERLATAAKDGSAADLDILDLAEEERRRTDSEWRQRQATFSNLYRERDLDLKQRRQKLAEQEFRWKRKQARARVTELEQKAATGRPLTEDDMRQIRAIYGLDSPGLATRDS